MAKNIQYDYVYRYEVLARLAQPLHIGNSSGDKCDVLVHPITHKPFIQATSLAGMMRDYSGGPFTEEDVSDLFGALRTEENGNAAEKGSRVMFSDGLFVSGNDIGMELRPHVAIDPDSGAAKPKAKFNMEYIGTGACFVFEITARSDEAHREKTETIIETVLAALNNGEIQLGGKKSSGCGKTELLSVMKKQYDMRTAEDRKAWIAASDISDIELSGKPSELQNEFETRFKGEHFDPISLDRETSDRIKYTITLTGAPEGEMLVKSLSPYFDESKDTKQNRNDKKEADADSIRNAKGDYIIPGSSIKGVLRHRTEAIAEYLEEKGKILSAEELVGNMFGKTTEDKDPAKPGNVITRDAVIGGSKSIKQKRIHIDKFTGGVMYQKLFTERVVTGKDIKIEVDILDGDDADAAAALILLVMRDVAVKSVSFGSGFNVGRGFIEAEELQIQDRSSGKTYSAKIREKGENTLDEFGKSLLSKIS